MNARDKELAVQAGFVAYELEDHTESGYDIRYERFADLIRADEREACAAACTAIALKSSNVILGVAVECAEAIRARGNT